MVKKLFFLQIVLLSLCVGAQPVGYYNGTEGLKGSALKAKLNEIISGQYFYQGVSSGVSNVWFSNKNDSYSNAKFVFLESDADPNIPGNVIDIYRGLSYDGDNYGTAAGTLNREHIWAKSHGNFPTNAAVYCDYHNLRPSEARINQKKSNLDFDWVYPNGTEYEGSGCWYSSKAWEPRTPVKGDVGRTLFYMDTRYEGISGELDLEVVNSLNTYPLPKHGKLDALYEWNTLDLPDFFEVNRNEVVYKYQGNRNPYVDNPYWVEMIWGNRNPATVLIGNMAQTPTIATDYNPVEISATVTNAPNISSVQLAWGFSFDDLENSENMDLESGRWLAQIPSQPQGTRIYLCVVVNSDGTRTESVRYSYYVYGTLPIAKIQGNGGHSPYENQQVSVTGIVTENNSNGYYIQDDANTRSEIYIYDANRKTTVGNVVQVTGTVADNNGVAEIKSLTSYKLLQIKYPLPQDVSAIPEIDDATSKIQLFPNPATNQITLQLEADFPVQNGTLRIFSIDGKLHYTEEITLQELKTGHRLNLDALSSGTWILSLKYSENTLNKIFIIK
jgi:endonuclease I